MLSMRLYLAQRITALIMAPLVLIHLGVMVYAVQGGLSASEILGRTQGSLFWGLIYGLFVIAASIHAAIGLRVVLFEWSQLSGARLNALIWLIFILLSSLGLRTVYAVVLS